MNTNVLEALAPRRGGGLRGFRQLVGLWRRRARERRRLATLDAHLLADVGLSAELARREAAKPFWLP